MGALVINGLVLPRTENFDPLAKIWSSCRKRISEQYGVHVTGLFVYDDEKEVISCSFCLSFTTNDDLKLYIKRFEDTFQYQMTMFEDAIEAFLMDQEDGYDAYMSLINTGKMVKKEAYESLFNKFLRKMNLKTKKDDKKKRKKDEAKNLF